MWLATDEYTFLTAVRPADYVGATPSCAIVNLARFDSLVACVQVGNLGDDGTVTVTEYTVHATTSQVFTAATYYRQAGSTSSTADVMGTRTAVATTGIITITDGTDDNQTLYIEVKSADLSAGYPCIGLAISVISTGAPLAVEYVMKPRYPGATISSATCVS